MCLNLWWFDILIYDGFDILISDGFDIIICESFYKMYLQLYWANSPDMPEQNIA
jgi:hypothetical protein